MVVSSVLCAWQANWRTGGEAQDIIMIGGAAKFTSAKQKMTTDLARRPTTLSVSSSARPMATLLRHEMTVSSLAQAGSCATVYGVSKGDICASDGLVVSVGGFGGTNTRTFSHYCVDQQKTKS